MRRGSPFAFTRNWGTCSYRSMSLSSIARGFGGYEDIDANLDRSAAVEVAEKSLIRAQERVEAARRDENVG